MLNGEKLGKEIWAEIQDLDPTETQKIWKIIADHICNHIKQNAIVKPGINVTTPNGIGKTTGVGKIQ